MRVRERREPGARRRHQERAREAARRRAGSRDRSCGRSCERTAARAAKRGSPTPQQAVAAVARRGSAPVVRAAASAAATLARARRRAIWRPHTRARAVLARRGCARRERRVPARDLATHRRGGYRLSSAVSRRNYTLIQFHKSRFCHDFEPSSAVGRRRLLGGALGSRDRTSWARQGPGLGPYSLAPPVEANLEHQWHRGLQALDTARP